MRTVDGLSDNDDARPYAKRPDHERKRRRRDGTRLALDISESCDLDENASSPTNSLRSLNADDASQEDSYFTSVVMKIINDELAVEMKAGHYPHFQIPYSRLVRARAKSKAIG